MSKKKLGVSELLFEWIYRAIFMSFQCFVNVLSLMNEPVVPSE
jgi:hypothetical protein